MRNIYYKDNRWYYEYPDNLEFADRCGGGVGLSLNEMEKIVAWAKRKKKRIEKNEDNVGKGSRKINNNSEKDKPF